MKIGTLLLILATCVAMFFAGKYSAKNIDTNITKIDTIAAKIDTIYSHTIDTIRILEKRKHIIDSIYVIDTTNHNAMRKDTSTLKKVFDSIYPKDTIDSNTIVGYSQIFGAILVNDKFIRDSSKLALTDTQLTVCEVGLDSLHSNAIMLADSAKKIATQEYNNGYNTAKKGTFKTILSISGLALVLGFGAGVYVAH